MADLKFDGDVSEISDRQLDYIRSVLQDRGFKNATVKVTAVGKPGDNYVASVKRFSVEKDGDTFKMVAKIAPTNEIIRANMQTIIMFQNEHVMYTDVLPKYTELEKGAGIPKKDRLRYATCYGSFTEVPNEVILLEDLQVSEFVMLDRFISLTDETVKLVLKNFAIIHSLSYALKSQEPEIYESYKNKLINTWGLMQNSEHLKAYFGILENQIVAILDDDAQKKQVKGLLSQLPKLAGKNINFDKNSKYSVIPQGDSWTNNILFKLQGGKTVECCMIDYQLSSTNSPVADIHYMIFNCTDYETRSKHYHEWIDYYHDQLDEHLSAFGLKAKLTYPRDQLDADLRRLGKVAFGLSMLLASVLMRESAEAAQFQDSMKSENSVEEIINMTNDINMGDATMSRFKNRISGLITSFVEFGYL